MLKSKLLKTALLAAAVGLTATAAVTPAEARDRGGWGRDDRDSDWGDRGGWSSSRDARLLQRVNDIQREVQRYVDRRQVPREFADSAFRALRNLEVGLNDARRDGRRLNDRDYNAYSSVAERVLANARSTAAAH